MPFPEKMASVSILVAARNEAAVVFNLMASLEALNYPKTHLQILIGNDDSSDNTAAIVAAFIKGKPYFELINITNSPNHQRGKANVLMQLAQVANGDYLFFTDADITVPSSWINAMLNGFTTENIGVVVGITATKPNSVFARCQGIEWLMALKFMELLNRFNQPSTGMGNNMAVSKKAYNAVGGYENLPFSIVEDFALYNAIIENNFGFKHIFSPKVMAFTEPPDNYFSQRKRWLKGGLDSRSLLIIPAVVQALALPLILLLLIVNQSVGISILLTYFGLTQLLGVFVLKKVNLHSWLPYLPFYFFYVNIFWCLQLINYFLPGKVNWKGRQY